MRLCGTISDKTLAIVGRTCFTPGRSAGVPTARQRFFSLAAARAAWTVAAFFLAPACDDYRDEALLTLRADAAESGGSGGRSGATGSGGIAAGSGGDAGSIGDAAAESAGSEAGVDATAGSGGAGGAADAAGGEAASDGSVEGGDASGEADAGGKDAGTEGGDGSSCPNSWVIEYRLHGDPPPGPPPPIDRTVFRSLVQNIVFNVGDHTDPIWQCLEGGQNCLGVGPGRLRLRFSDVGGRPGDEKSRWFCTRTVTTSCSPSSRRGSRWTRTACCRRRRRGWNRISGPDPPSRGRRAQRTAHRVDDACRRLSDARHHHLYRSPIDLRHRRFECRDESARRYLCGPVQAVSAERTAVVRHARLDRAGRGIESRPDRVGIEIRLPIRRRKGGRSF